MRARPISYAYPEAAPPDLTPPVSPSAMRAAVYDMPRWEAGMMLRREDLAIVCSIGRYIDESEILGVDLKCLLFVLYVHRQTDRHEL